MKNCILTILVLIFSSQIYSQGKIEAITNRFKENDSYTINIRIATSGSKWQDGVLQIKGDKFKLSTDDGTIFSDGESYYNYSEKLKEITIEPLDDSSPFASPRSFFEIAGDRFEVVSETKSGNKDAYRIKSTIEDSAVSEIMLTTTNNKIETISIIDNANNTIDIEVVKVDFSTKIDDKAFTFKRQNKNIEVIDFR